MSEGTDDAARVFVVLGMHRSGTSAVARGVQALGVTLGSPLLPPNAENPGGFWEHEAIVDLNERLLRALHLRWDSIRLIRPESWESDEVEAFLAEFSDLAARYFRGEHRWAFKDPRTMRLLPFWQRALLRGGFAPSYIFVVRNPLSVAESLRSRNQFSIIKSQLLWLAYNLPAVSALRDSAVVFVDYDRLVDSPVRELGRVAKTLGLDLENAKEELSGYAEEFLDPALRHFRLTAEDLRRHPDVLDPVRRAYQWLHQLAADEITLRDHPLLSGWSALERSWRSSSKLAECIDEVEAHLVELQEAHQEALENARSEWDEATAARRLLEGERVRLEKRASDLVVERDEATAARRLLEGERVRLEKRASDLVVERDEATAARRLLEGERVRLEKRASDLVVERDEATAARRLLEGERVRLEKRASDLVVERDEATAARRLLEGERVRLEKRASDLVVERDEATAARRLLEGERVRLEKRASDLVVERDEATAARRLLEGERVRLEKRASDLVVERDEATAARRLLEGERVRLEKRASDLVVERDEATAARRLLEGERVRLEKRASLVTRTAARAALEEERTKLERYASLLLQERDKAV